MPAEVTLRNFQLKKNTNGTLSHSKEALSRNATVRIPETSLQILLKNMFFKLLTVVLNFAVLESGLTKKSGSLVCPVLTALGLPGPVQAARPSSQMKTAWTRSPQPRWVQHTWLRRGHPPHPQEHPPGRDRLGLTAHSTPGCDAGTTNPPPQEHPLKTLRTPQKQTSTHDSLCCCRNLYYYR